MDTAMKLPTSPKDTLDVLLDLELVEDWYEHLPHHYNLSRLAEAATYAFRHDTPQNMRLYQRLEWGD